MFACGAFAIASAFAAGPLAAEPACAPTVHLSGAPELVMDLSRSLRARGVHIAGAARPSPSHAPPDTCTPPVGAARVESSSRGIAVLFRDPGGQTEAREVSTTDIAATWIESRLRRDVSRPLLAARIATVSAAASSSPASAPAGGAAPGARQHPLAERDRLPATEAGGSLAAARVHVAAFAEFGSDDRNSTWGGIGGTACVRTGPVCLGVVGRAGWASRDDTLERSNYEVLGLLSVPMQAGRVTVSPDIAVGIGSVTTEEPAFVAPAPGCADGSSAPECGAPWARFQTLSGRAAVGVTASIPIADRLHLDLRVEGSAAVGARTADFMVDDPFSLPPPDPGPDGEPGDDGRVLYRIEGEPGRVVRAGIGLRLGVW